MAVTKKVVGGGGKRTRSAGPVPATFPAGVQIVGTLAELPFVMPTKRSLRYADKLAEIASSKAKVGEFAVVATFAGRGGATQVLKKITDRVYLIHGELDDWEFATRRNVNGGSTLYAAKACARAKSQA